MHGSGVSRGIPCIPLAHVSLLTLFSNVFFHFSLVSPRGCHGLTGCALPRDRLTTVEEACLRSAPPAPPFLTPHLLSFSACHQCSFCMTGSSHHADILRSFLAFGTRLRPRPLARPHYRAPFPPLNPANRLDAASQLSVSCRDSPGGATSDAPPTSLCLHPPESPLA
ncbi:hypothetical protein Efla_000140 [Eimeria flavescens]